MRVYYNSRDEYYKSPFGAVKTGTEITFRIRVDEPIKGLRVYFCLWHDNVKIDPIEMEREEDNGAIIFKTVYKAPIISSLIWYHFLLENFEEKYYYSNNDNQYGGEGKLVEYNPISYQQTVYKKDTAVSWFKGGVVYQIFPDRFYRGSDYKERKKNTLNRIKNKNHGKVFIDDWNKIPRYKREANGDVKEFEFFGGTLKGIEEKLPYLVNLGVTAIYLNPIFEARSNHRYDTGDYMTIDSLLGDEKSFEDLINAAKKVGIKIIIDGVFSHQGADSIYFNKYENYDSVGAYNSKNSKYFEWYNFKNYPNEYDAWWGVGDLPNVNELNKSYLDYICQNEDSVVKHWMKKGVAGIRLDVADELPDEFIIKIRKAMDEVDKKNILIGEVWEDATNKVSYNINRKYFINASLKSVTNYPFMKKAIAFVKGNLSSEELCQFFYQQMEHYPTEYFNNSFNLIDSHDRVRVITELADSRNVDTLSDEEKYNHYISEDKYKLAVSRLKTLSVLQFTIPGVPVVYYGDEAGVYGYTDPYNRKTYPWGNENEELIAHYKMLGEMRKKNKILSDGDFKCLVCGKHTFGFERSYKNERMIILVNRGIFYNEGEHIELDVKCDKIIDVCSKEGITIANGKLSVDMTPLGYRVFKLVSNMGEK